MARVERWEPEKSVHLQFQVTPGNLRPVKGFAGSNLRPLGCRGTGIALDENRVLK
jgi:hypothetical protein